MNNKEGDQEMIEQIINIINNMKFEIVFYFVVGCLFVIAGWGIRRM